jgi:hypothetical protein
MSDLLQSTAVSFLACLDRVLIPDFPFSLIVADPDCLVAAEQASFLSMQRSNRRSIQRWRSCFSMTSPIAGCGGWLIR